MLLCSDVVTRDAHQLYDNAMHSKPNKNNNINALYETKLCAVSGRIMKNGLQKKKNDNDNNKNHKT